MKLRIAHAWPFALACLLAATPAAAETALAQITGIYVELEAGVRAERSGRSIEAGKPLLAEVHIPAHDGAPARTALVRMNDIDAALGDRVEVNLGETGLITGVRATRPYIVRVESHEATALAQQAPRSFIALEPKPLPQVLARREAQAPAPGLLLTLSRELTRIFRTND